MALNDELDNLLTGVQGVVDEGLMYFQGPGATSQARVDLWGPHEMLCHFLFWHEVTVLGMESVAAGGEPTKTDAPVDELNANVVSGRSGQGFSQLIQEARQLQERLEQASQALTDLDAVVTVRFDGTQLTARQRLETIAHHWREHLDQLQAAASP